MIAVIASSYLGTSLGQACASPEWSDDTVLARIKIGLFDPTDLPESWHEGKLNKADSRKDRSWTPTLSTSSS